MNFINLTPHPINIQCGEKQFVIEPSGVTCRVETGEVVERYIDDIPVIRRNVTGVTLPEPCSDTVYIVSSMVLDAMKSYGIIRSDIVAPDTGATAIRNDKGQIAAVTRLVGI